ncbi:hypothetical protein MRB53_014120 [Persea americana]|uniref:Uncharacterized protein n=1 Tax=Persea americana TaxID=3435 RepID=A0ACC2K9W6_PERAE|nr:hypothetical protein MRB53_014120 [Persea americana]
MSSSSAPKKRGLGRGPNQIPKAPVNPDERILIQMRPHPDSTTGLRQQLRGRAHLSATRMQFGQNFRYRWDDAHASIIQTIFWQKCAARTKDNLSKERQKASQNAQINHPGQAEEYMHEYSPWWCAPTIWAGMCEQWKAESWVKRRRTAAVNRASGAPEGNKAPGTYKGGSISQLQHVAAKEASSQGQPIHWLDVYVATRDGLPDAVQIVETYNTLMDERYPEGTSRPLIDQELWERVSVVKKNYVKGQGQRRRPTISGTGSSGSQSTQSSYQPMPHTAADCVRAICRDRDLLRTLRVHLQSLDPDESANVVAIAAQQEIDNEVADNSVAVIGRQCPPSDQIICVAYQRLYVVADTDQRPHAVADVRSQIGCFLVVEEYD